MESIKAVGGILVPIVVYQESSHHYVLLDGERRWRATKALMKDDARFSKVPANIIAKPPGEFDNLKTMFNIHYKRKNWTTAALSEALGKLQKLGKADLITTHEVSRLTGLTPVAVDEARLFLRMPQDIRQQCLEGKLNEYYVILLGRNLRAVEKSYPELMKRYQWDDLVKAFIQKVDQGYIKRSRSFNYLSQMARFTIEHDAESTFETTFDRMIREVGYTPDEAREDVRSKLGVMVEEDFRARCKQFLAFLESYTEEKGTAVGSATKDLLRKIANRITAQL